MSWFGLLICFVYAIIGAFLPLGLNLVTKPMYKMLISAGVFFVASFIWWVGFCRIGQTDETKKE